MGALSPDLKKRAQDQISFYSSVVVPPNTAST